MLLVLSLVFAGQVSAEQPKKQRRLIVNDDAEPEVEGKSIEDYLSVRFSDTVGTQVDSYFLCVAVTSESGNSSINPRGDAGIICKLNESMGR